MCLEKVTTDVPLIAEEDIICFKYLFELMKEHTRDRIWKDLPEKERILFTPYMRKLIDRSVLYSELKMECEVFQSVHVKWTIDQGIHSFVNLKNAIDDANMEKQFFSFQKNFNENICKVHLFQCIIPKGTRYWVGKYCYNSDSYCSERIIYVNQLYDWI